MNETFSMQVREATEDRRKKVASFSRGERADWQNLREIFVGLFHDNVKQGAIVQLARAGFEDANQVRAGKLGGSAPAGKMDLRLSLLLGD